MGSGNRRRATTSGERVVVFICTGVVAGGHPRRKLGTVALRDGIATEVTTGRDTLRRALVAREVAREAPGVRISAFDYYCSQCGQHPQFTQSAMNKLIASRLDSHPDRARVPTELRGL